MARSQPILFATTAACLLQACAAPATQRALKIEPVLQVRHSGAQSAATYYQLGKYHQERGELGLARSAYIHSIKFDSQQIEARNALAVLDSQQGKLDDAKAILLQLIHDYPKIAYLYNNLAYIYYLKGDYHAAIPTVERSLALEPGNARAHNNLDLIKAALSGKRARLHTAQGPEPVTIDNINQVPDASNIKLHDPVTKTDNAAELSLQQAIIAARPASLQMAPQMRMDVVQILPNVIELKRRFTFNAVNAERDSGKSFATKQVIAEYSGQDKVIRLDVINGNGVQGLAGRMRHALAQRGIPVKHLANKRPYNTQKTEILYRTGFAREAERIRSTLNIDAGLTPVSTAFSSSDIWLLLGKDTSNYLSTTKSAKLSGMTR